MRLHRPHGLLLLSLLATGCCGCIDAVQTGFTDGLNAAIASVTESLVEQLLSEIGGSEPD